MVSSGDDSDNDCAAICYSWHSVCCGIKKPVLNLRYRLRVFTTLSRGRELIYSIALRVF